MAKRTVRALPQQGVTALAFIQIMDFHTDRMEEGKQYVDEYRAKTEGRRTSQRTVLCQDRDRPGHYVNFVVFDSYESAMENSNLPETQELAQKIAELTTSEIKFLNLEVEWDET